MTRSTRTVPSRRRRGSALLLGGAVIAVLGLSGGLAVAAASDDPAVVDGRAVTRDELLFHMERVRPVVEAEAGDTADLDERLRVAALDEVAADRALTDLAAERGLDVPADHADFLRAVEGAEASRAEQRAAGEVVYGAALRPADAWSKLLADLRESLLVDPEVVDSLGVTDADVRATYEADPGAWAAKATELRVTRVVLPGIDPAAPPAPVGGADLDVLVASWPGATAAATTLTPETDDVSDIDPRVVAELQSLAPGPDAVASPTVEGDAWVVYRLDAAETDEAAALQTYGPRLRAVLMERRLDAELSRSTDRQHHEIDARAWRDLTTEDLDR